MTVQANGIYCGDCLSLLQMMPTGFVDLTVTSPPYEDCRLYGEIKFKLKGQSWVDWMIPRVVEMCRVTSGLVFINAAGKVKDWKYSPIIEWLVADLTRHHGLVCGPSPYVFAKQAGTPGSGSTKYHRRDWEPVYAFARPECLPVKWSDNTAMGHAPKWAPGGEMSNRNSKGERANRNQWGGTKKNGKHRKSSGEGTERYERPSHRFGKMADTIAEDGAEPKVAAMLAAGLPPGSKLHTKNNGSKMRVQCYTAPAIANPGNIIRCKVGGGLMGSKKAHESEAPFPEKLVEFFIRSYCPEGGITMDPFCGSGTTLAVAEKWGRKWIGLELRPGQCELSAERVKEIEKPLLK